MSQSVIYMKSQEGYLNKYTSYSRTLLAPSCNCTNSYSMAMFMIMWLSVDCVHDSSVHTQSLKALCHYIYMWWSMTKPTTLGTMSFWVKATITKYNLWSTDHANLKSLVPVGSEIWARMYLDCLYYNFTASIMKHCHGMLYVEVCIVVVFARYVAPPTTSMSWDGYQNTRMRASAEVSTKKDDRTSVFKDNT